MISKLILTFEYIGTRCQYFPSSLIIQLNKEHLKLNPQPVVCYLQRIGLQNSGCTLLYRLPQTSILKPANNSLKVTHILTIITLNILIQSFKPVISLHLSLPFIYHQNGRAKQWFLRLCHLIWNQKETEGETRWKLEVKASGRLLWFVTVERLDQRG